MVPNVTPGATSDRVMAHTFTAIPADLASATLTFRVRAGGSDQQNAEGTDSMRLGFASGTGQNALLNTQWRRFFGTGNAGDPGYFNFPWRIYTSHPACDQTITLDLAALPVADGGTLNLLPEVRQRGNLDFSVSDDSGVDYARLTGTTNDGRTVAWGAAQPLENHVCLGGAASFNVAAGGTGPATIQWRKDGTPLSDGPTGTGSILNGSETFNLQIVAVGADDIGSYDCVVTNSCGPTTSNAASLSVLPSGTGDGNGDSAVNGLDIQGFINAISSGSAPSDGYCAYDMDRNGVVSLLDVPLFVSYLITAP